MRAVIDTSSLQALVRYYLPFDPGQRLYNFLQEKLEVGEIILIEEVYFECKTVAQGEVLKAFPYLSEKKHRQKMDDLLPPKSIFNRVENDFAITMQKQLLSEAEFENRKQQYMASADFKLILFALREKARLDDPVVIVTEETSASNDRKLFKKIPAICGLQGMDLTCWPLPRYLKSAEGINFAVE